MTIQQFFKYSDGSCRHIQVPGTSTSSDACNHIIFYQLASGNIEVLRMIYAFTARVEISKELMQSFLDLRIGISDLWKNGGGFFWYGTKIEGKESGSTLTEALLKKVTERA